MIQKKKDKKESLSFNKEKCSQWEKSNKRRVIRTDITADITHLAL